MKAAFAIAAAASLVATPVLAGPPVKRQPCQLTKNAVRDVKREPCRRQVIPPVLDPTPMFLASTTAAAPAARSSLS